MHSPSDSEEIGWSPVSTVEAGALSLLAAWIVWQHFFTDETWVFLLDSANLALHEAGHPMLGMLSGAI